MLKNIKNLEIGSILCFITVEEFIEMDIKHDIQGSF